MVWVAWDDDGADVGAGGWCSRLDVENARRTRKDENDDESCEEGEARPSDNDVLLDGRFWGSSTIENVDESGTDSIPSVPTGLGVIPSRELVFADVEGLETCE